MVKNFEGREQEGVILVDSDYRRVKVKSPSYLLLHHTMTNVPTNITCMRSILINDHEELKAVHPNLGEMIDTFYTGFQKMLKIWEENHQLLVKEHGNSPKEFAIGIKKLKKKRIYF